LTTNTTADRVFGQPNFGTSTPNNGGVSASSLQGVAGITLDSGGNLFVADYYNHRVLEYDAPLTTDTTADRVFGQPNFGASTPNNGGVSASSLHSPSGITADAAGNLFMVDTGNGRVLEYDAPLATDTIADRVFGQPNFTTGSFDSGDVSPTSLSGPMGVAVDSGDRLFIADTGNNRVLEYDLSIINPQPTITDLSQSEALAGSSGFTLTITGTNFISGTIMRWNDTDRLTTFISGTQLTAEIDATDLETAGSASITVFSPTPGGGASNVLTFTIRPRYAVYLPLITN
jgi:sugar lactone lactonase YvrE